jgi:hypothetical protein
MDEESMNEEVNNNYIVELVNRGESAMETRGNFLLIELRNLSAEQESGKHANTRSLPLMT